MEDNTGLEQATLWLDGEEVLNESLTGQTGVVSFTPPGNLSYSGHFYHLSVTDIDGNEATMTKIFTVYYQSSGCFLKGTPVQKPDNTTISIEELKAGDVILAFDEETGQFKPDTVKNVFIIPGEEQYLIINGHLEVTPGHCFYVEGMWKEAGQLKVGDILLNVRGEPEPITSIERKEEFVTVYNLEVNPYHTFIAGGIVVHNAELAETRDSTGSLQENRALLVKYKERVDHIIRP